MRDFILLSVLGPFISYSLLAPQVGLLLWCWVAFGSPQQLVYGFLASKPINLIVALASICGWVFSKEPKVLPRSPAAVLIYVLMVWITVTSYFGIGDQTRNWEYWDRSEKTFILVLLIMAVCHSRARINSIVWVVILALGSFGVKGGLFVLATAGNYSVVGPTGTIITDNNHLSVALNMTIPLFIYLMRYSTNKFIKLGLLASVIFTILAVVGTYSRAGFVGLAIVLGFFWLRSKAKVWVAILFIVMIVPATHFMPEKWFNRMNSIENAGTDSSFQGRVDAWRFATNIAIARPLTAGGFGAFYDPNLWPTYAPGRSMHAPHSIYFEALGSHGFLGLALFLGIAAVSWQNAFWITRQTKNIPDLAWARDLSILIQVSFAAYFTAGATVTLAFYDLYYTLVAVLVLLRQHVADELRQRAPPPEASPAPRVVPRRAPVGIPAKLTGAPVPKA
ncbi:MAG: putative O-glycosylation ligase, exosortase system-associated [Rhodospirillales bacterium]|nr:putative O-glycosylation ligase, exosortase system-associated [Rhodospirillales bacterium]